jgi:hypothetical protein
VKGRSFGERISWTRPGPGGAIWAAVDGRYVNPDALPQVCHEFGVRRVAEVLSAKDGKFAYVVCGRPSV